MANKELQEKLLKYVEKYKGDKFSGINMGSIGLAMGYNSGSSVISGYLSGTYKGGVDILEARLEEYFRNVEAQEEHDTKTAALQLPEEYVELSISSEVYHAIRLAHLRKRLVAVVGDSGVGKTMAAIQYAKDHPTSSVYLEVTPVNGTLRSFLRVLAREMGLSDLGSNLDLDDRIRAHLLGMNRVLILDEAQNLKFSTLEVLKSWSDGDQKHGMKGVGLALIGNPDIESQMEGPKYDRHYNRRVFIQRCQREKITKDDVRLLFPMLADKANEDKFQLLYGMCRSRSAVRGAVYAYTNAVSQCQENGTALSYEALLAQARGINPLIGLGRN